MKTVFALVFLPTIYSLSCLDPKNNRQLFLSTFDLNNTKEHINQLIASDDGETCLVTIELLPNKNILEITFDSKRTNNDPVNGEVEFGTTLVSDANSNIDHAVVLKYACQNPDNCQKDFVLNHIEWFVQINYTDMTVNSAGLFFGTKQRGQCLFKNEIVLCPNNTICVAFLTQEGLARGCTENPGRTYWHIQIRINITNPIERHSMLFVCDYDKCNSDGVLSGWTAYINEKYDISPVRKGLGYYQSMESTTIINPTISAIHTEDPKKSTTLFSTSIKSSSEDHLSMTTTSSASVTSTITTTTISSASTTSTIATTTRKSGVASRSENTKMTVGFGMLLVYLVVYRFAIY